MPVKELSGRELWGRMEGESAKAYASFLYFLKLPPRVRSIPNALRLADNLTKDQPLVGLGKWEKWSSTWEWIKRALAYDDHNAAEELEKWEERKRIARENDWQQANALRAIVDGALPSANQFFKRQVGQPQGGVPTVVDAEGRIISQGVPAQVIITVAFDVVGMTTVLREASKIQRLTVNEPTDNINNLTGATLDAALQRALDQLALEAISNGGETGDAQRGHAPHLLPQDYDADSEDDG